MPSMPTITPEQRADALAKAVIVRAARAEVRSGLKRGELTIGDVLGLAHADVHGGMRVTTVLEAMPGVGKARARRIMERLRIADGRRVRGLGPNQRAALTAEFETA